MQWAQTDAGDDLPLLNRNKPAENRTLQAQQTRTLYPAEKWGVEPLDMTSVAANRRRARTPSPEREASAAPTTVLDPFEVSSPNVCICPLLSHHAHQSTYLCRVLLPAEIYRWRTAGALQSLGTVSRARTHICGLFAPSLSSGTVCEKM
jgi:hypothetical protein